MRNFSYLLHESLLIQFSSEFNKAVLGLSKAGQSINACERKITVEKGVMLMAKQMTDAALRRQIAQWTRSALWEGRLSREAGASMFQGLRLRLTLWYCAVLGVALLLFGVVLYLGTQYFLLSPIESDAAMHAQGHMNEWLSGAIDRACPSFGPQGQFGPPGQNQGFFMSEIVACFDQNSSLLSGEDTTGLPSAFLTSTLAKTALQTGQPAWDIVDAGGSGLGLSMARSIAIAHGGRLAVASIPDEGKTVTLVLPLAYGTTPDHEGDTLGSAASLQE